MRTLRAVYALCIGAVAMTTSGCSVAYDVPPSPTTTPVPQPVVHWIATPPPGLLLLLAPRPGRHQNIYAVRSNGLRQLSLDGALGLGVNSFTADARHVVVSEEPSFGSGALVDMNGTGEARIPGLPDAMQDGQAPMLNSHDQFASVLVVRTSDGQDETFAIHVFDMTSRLDRVIYHSLDPTRELGAPTWLDDHTLVLDEEDGNYSTAFLDTIDTATGRITRHLPTPVSSYALGNEDGHVAVRLFGDNAGGPLVTEVLGADLQNVDTFIEGWTPLCWLPDHQHLLLADGQNRELAEWQLGGNRPQVIARVDGQRVFGCAVR